MVKDDLVFHLVNDLLWINKEEEGELKREEQDGDGIDIMEGQWGNGGTIFDGGGFGEEEQKDGRKEECEKKVGDEESKKEVEEANVVGIKNKEWSIGDKYTKRKGEDLWLEMWGKEMKSREVEREKERIFKENQRSQVLLLSYLQFTV